MKKKKSYTKNYIEFNDNFQLVLPLNLENLIPEDASVRLLIHVLEELNYKKLYKAYSSVGRKTAVEPKIMFQIITHAYFQNIYSSRKIEKACRRDINFRWKLLYMNVKIVITALTKQSTQKQKEIERCKFRKPLWKSVNYLMKILQLSLEVN